jgi:hypothetical protein
LRNNQYSAPRLNFAPPHVARRRRPSFAENPAPLKVRLKFRHGAEADITVEYIPHRCRFGLVHHKLAIRHVVPQRHAATHPHTFTLRGRDLVSDTFACDLALKLCKRQQHVQRQATHRRGRVELLRDRHEAGSVAVQRLDDSREVCKGAGQPVDLVHDDDVDPTSCHFRQQALQRRPLHAAARKAAIIVAGLHKPPALVCLALDVGFAGLALGMQGVEGLFQAVLARLARIDGATAKRGHD